MIMRIDQDKLKFIMDLKNRKRGRIKEYAEKYGCEYWEDEKTLECKV